MAASVRKRDHRPAAAHRAESPDRAAHRPFRHLDEDGARRQDRPCRFDVLVDADAAAPHRQQPAEALDQGFAPLRRERRWSAAEDPAARLDGKRVHDHQRVHPASMGAGDQQVAAGRDVLLARRLDPESEQAEADEPDQQPGRAIQERRLGLRGTAEPREALGRAAAGGGHGFRRDPAGRRSSTTALGLGGCGRIGCGRLGRPAAVGHGLGRGPGSSASVPGCCASWSVASSRVGCLAVVGRLVVGRLVVASPRRPRSPLRRRARPPRPFPRRWPMARRSAASSTPPRARPTSPPAGWTAADRPSGCRGVGRSGRPRRWR